MYVLGIVVITAILIYAVLKSRSNWMRLEVATGIEQEDRLQYKYEELKSEGVRARLKKLEMENNLVTAGVPDTAPSGTRSALEVHKNDYDNARVILERTERPLY